MVEAGLALPGLAYHVVVSDPSTFPGGLSMWFLARVNSWKCTKLEAEH